jgi:acyl-CoA thioesterase
MVRSMTMHFLRPPDPGPAVIRATVERAGRSLSSVSARLEQDGELMGLALAAFSIPWASPEINESPMPEVTPPDGRKTLDELFPQAGPFPDFTRKLTMQPRFGAPPFSGAEVSEIGGWLGLAEERPIDSLATVLLADAWFPAPWPRLRKLAPAPTIDLSVHFRSPLPLADTMLLGRFRTRLVRDGFFEEDGELWAPGGALVAQSRQLALLIGAEV